MISAEDLVGEEWAEGYPLTPAQRWNWTTRLWRTCLAFEGSIDSEHDTQSPSFDPRVPRPLTVTHHPNMRAINQSGI